MSACKWMADMLLAMFTVYLFFLYFGMFFERRKKNIRVLLGVIVLVLWQVGIPEVINELPKAWNIGTTVGLALFVVANVFEGKAWMKCFFAVTFAAIWMLARYFTVLRPRAGTTEWIGRLTPPPWQPVSGCPLHGMDAPAALLLCLAVTGLRLLEHWLRFHALPVTPEALLPVLFAGLAAACAHLLLRRLVGGMLPALSGALFFGLLQDGSLAVTAALLGYVLWRTAKRRGGGWIVLSVICFAAGLLKERALLLLLPLYPIGYVCTRLSRRTGLGRSLALTLPLSLLGALGVAVLGWWMAGRGTPLEALRSFRFYEALWPALCGNVRAAVTLPGRFSPTELALGALAVLTLPELLHGLCRGRDLRCAMILLLLVSAAALWALSGLFLLPLPLAMALAWVWQRLCDRGAAVSAAVPAAVLALCAVSSILFMF